MKKLITEHSKKSLLAVLAIVFVASSAFVIKATFFKNTESITVNDCIQIEYPDVMGVGSTSQIQLKKDGAIFQPASVSWAVLGDSSGDILFGAERLTNEKFPILNAVKAGKVNLVVTLQDKNSENLCGKTLVRELVTINVTENALNNSSSN